MNRRGRQPAADELLRRIPREGDLFRGAAAWAEDLPEWRRTSRELLRDPEGPVRRSAWNDPSEPDARVLVDVVECASARLAVTALLERLAWNQLAEVPPGPPSLGVASFAHPEGVSPAVYFARANLCITVASFAGRAAPVLDVAQAIDRRLLREPDRQGPPLGVEAARDPRGARPPVVRVFQRYTPGEESHLRFRATGGTLEIREDEVAFERSGAEDAWVEVFAEEAGRPTAFGRVAIPQ
jgi:hypothetical protein